MKIWPLTTMLVIAVVGYWLSPLRSSAPPIPKNVVYLSTFLPHAGGCGWYRTRLPEGEDEPIVRFHVDCQGISLAWHKEYQKAVVWTGGDMDLMAWVVDIPGKQSARLPAIEGDVKQFFFTDKNRIAALVDHQAENDAIVQDTFELVAGTWQQNNQMAPARHQSGDPLHQPSNWQVVSDNYLYSQLDPLITSALQRPERQWYRFAPKDQVLALLAFATQTEIPSRVPALLRWDSKGEVRTLPDLDFSLLDSVTLASRSGYLLIVESDSHMSPQVYSLDHGRLVYASKPAHLVEFWPEPPRFGQH